MSEYQTWREYLIEKLAVDHERAIDYLDVALEEYQVDKDTHLFLVALRTVIESKGGTATLAKRACLEPQILLEILSGEEMPRIDMLNSIFAALGCRLSIEPLKTTEHRAEFAPAETSIVPSEVSSPNLEVSTENQ